MSASKRRRMRMRRAAKPIDQVTDGRAYSGPGMDTRQWISIGLVDAGNSGDDIVVFDEEDGQVLVRVLLEPRKIPVFARVGTNIAGNGEGEYHPFVQGDEVVVVIPEGNERSGCVIIARLNNAIDPFPMESVAGQDPTTNTFAFARRRTPFVHENAGPIMFRSALTGSFMSIDSNGAILMRDGEQQALSISADGIVLQGPSDPDTPPTMLLQMNNNDQVLSIQVGDATLQLATNSDVTTTQIQTPTSITLGSSGNFAAEHAMTVEQFVNIMVTILAGLPTPVPSPDVLIAAALTAGTTSGPWSVSPLSQAAITTAIAGMPPKLPSSILLPGVACPGLIVG